MERGRHRKALGERWEQEEEVHKEEDELMFTNVRRSACLQIFRSRYLVHFQRGEGHSQRALNNTETFKAYKPQLQNVPQNRDCLADTVCRKVRYLGKYGILLINQLLRYQQPSQQLFKLGFYNS